MKWNEKMVFTEKKNSDSVKGKVSVAQVTVLEHVTVKVSCVHSDLRALL